MLLKKTILYQTANNILNLDPYRIVYSILSDEGVQEFIEDLNRKQLLEGKNSLDVKLSAIGGGYSNFTLRLNPEKRRDRVNLYDTGEFHSSIDVKINPNEGFEIDADPIKIGDNGFRTNLYDRWGIDIIGLSQSNLQKLIDEILEQLIPQILQEIHKHS